MLQEVLEFILYTMAGAATLIMLWLYTGNLAKYLYFRTTNFVAYIPPSNPRDLEKFRMHLVLYFVFTLLGPFNLIFYPALMMMRYLDKKMFRNITRSRIFNS